MEYAIFIKDTIKIMLDSSEQGVYKWNLLDFHHFFPDKRNIFLVLLFELFICNGVHLKECDAEMR